MIGETFRFPAHAPHSDEGHEQPEDFPKGVHIVTESKIREALKDCSPANQWLPTIPVLTDQLKIRRLDLFESLFRMDRAAAYLILGGVAQGRRSFDAYTHMRETVDELRKNKQYSLADFAERANIKYGAAIAYFIRLDYAREAFGFTDGRALYQQTKKSRSREKNRKDWKIRRKN